MDRCYVATLRRLLVIVLLTHLLVRRRLAARVVRTQLGNVRHERVVLLLQIQKIAAAAIDQYLRVVVSVIQFALLLLCAQELVAIVKKLCALIVVLRALSHFHTLFLLFEIVSEVDDLWLAVAVVNGWIKLNDFLQITVYPTIDNFSTQYLTILTWVVHAATPFQLAVYIYFLRSRLINWNTITIWGLRILRVRLHLLLLNDRVLLTLIESLAEYCLIVFDFEGSSKFIELQILVLTVRSCHQ